MNSSFSLLSRFPIRKTKEQKQAFLDAVQSELHRQGYACKVENGRFGCRNLVAGDPESARYLVTAHYDTCARLPFPNLCTPCNPVLFYGIQLIFIVFLAALFLCVVNVSILLFGDHRFSALLGHFSIVLICCLMLAGPANRNNWNDNTSGVVTVLEIARSLPENYRNQVCFVLFDLEELGLIGSACYRKRHKKASDNQIVLNLDCVGDGDEILFFPTKRLKKATARMNPLYQCCGYFGKKSVLIRDKGFSVYPSDQRNFPYGVGIAALKRGKWGLYLDRIHTDKDTILEETNVNILRAAIVSLICCDAVKKG